MLIFAPGVRQWVFDSRWRYNLKIILALSGAAAALTDLDDRLTGRLRNLLITLVSFFIAAVSIELLFPYPWLFALDLRFYFAGGPWAALCHHRLWRPTHCGVYHAGHSHVPKLV